MTTPLATPRQWRRASRERSSRGSSRIVYSKAVALEQEQQIRLVSPAWPLRKCACDPRLSRRGCAVWASSCVLCIRAPFYRANLIITSVRKVKHGDRHVSPNLQRAKNGKAKTFFFFFYPFTELRALQSLENDNVYGFMFTLRRQPFITAIGRSLTHFEEIPAAWHVSTTSFTSLYDLWCTTG